ncbi:MAG: hypothetical protein OXR72_03850 [Gemmatimonadota bacterium]|nr:hypothetical protein [Gemmatimonadota bacterium]
MPTKLCKLLTCLGVMILLAACGGEEKPAAPATEPAPAETTDNTPRQPRPLLSDSTFSADSNPTGNPIGGGEGYDQLVEEYDYLVTNRAELLDALEQATQGQVVYLADTARVDLTGDQKIEIAGGVTLASGRGKPDTEGGLVYSKELETIPLFVAAGPGVRVTGLRLEGPDTMRRTEQMRQLSAEGRYYSIPNSRGIETFESRLEVDNCELFGWSHGAIFLRANSTDNHIHHNYFHHNQRHGLGYGVVMDQSEALIEANLFDWCRHHIAGTGRPGTSYEARYNLVLENANSHSFDMHGGRDRGDGTDIAGTVITIHHNTFLAIDVAAVVIRGVPEEYCDIYNNWFIHFVPSVAVKQTNAKGNVRHYSNQYTNDRVVKD